MTRKADDKKIMLSTRQDPALVKKVKRYAIEHDMSLQKLVALALEELLKKGSGPRR